MNARHLPVAAAPCRARGLALTRFWLVSTLAAMLLTAVPAMWSGTAAQPGTSFTSTQFAYQLAWLSPWLIEEQVVEEGFEAVLLTDGNKRASFIALSVEGAEMPLSSARDVLNLFVSNLVIEMADARVLQFDRAAAVPWAELSFTCPLGAARSLVEAFTLREGAVYLVTIVEAPEFEVEQARQQAATGITLDGNPFVGLDRPDMPPSEPTAGTDVPPVAEHGGGPADSGLQPGPAPAGPPLPIWSFATGDDFVGASSAVVSIEHGLAFTSSNAIYAIDIATGQEAWSLRSDSGVGFVSPLALANGVLYAGGEDGVVYALDPSTGAVIWRTTLEPMLSVWGGPIVGGDGLYVTTIMGTIHALDIATGELRWERQLGMTLVGQPAFAGGYLVVPGPPTGDSALNGALALDATTGMTVWAVKVPTAVRPYPVIAGGTVYLGADNGILYAIDLASGVQRWAAETGAPISSAPAVSGGLVFVPGAGSVLGAYDAATGAEVWTAPVPVTELGGITAAPTSEGTTVILVGDDIGVLHAFDAAGAEVWAVEVTDASLTRWRPTVVDGVVYASGMDGTLHALAAQDSGIGTPAPTPGPAQGTTPVPRPGDLILPPLKATETPVPVQVPTPTPAPVVAQVPTPTLAPTPPPAPTPADQAVYADAGLVEPGYYVSPHTSTEIRWDTVAWELDPWFDPPVVSSNAGDELYLAVTTQNGVSMAVYIYPSYGDTMDEIMSFVSSSTNIADVFGPDAEVVLNTAAGPRGALVVRDASGGFDPWMIYSEFYLVNDGEVLVEVQLVAPASMATEAITAAQAQITLDGQPVMTFYPTADVAAALGS